MPRILLVEDNEMNREMLSRRLARKGFDLVVAVDGLSGLAMATAERPDLVLMDMSLPGIDGWEATRRIRADPATQSLPVIALTAHAMSDDRAKALAAGCDDFDTKPVDLERLLGKIARLLDRPAQAPLQMDPPGRILWSREWTLPAQPQSLPVLQAGLDELCTRLGIGRERRADLQVVLDELCANIVAHAYAGRAAGDVHMVLRHLGAHGSDGRAEPAAIALSLRDHGHPFNPLTQPEPDVSLPADERPIGGLGIHLVRQLTDQQHYSHSPSDGNRITVIKHLS